MASYVEVPHGSLSARALEGLIEDFITREGTDYGEREYSLEQKRAQVFESILRGDVVIVFDLGEESVTLIPRRELERAERA